MKIGVISDTHGWLRPEVAALMGTCDAILHAGDIHRAEVWDAPRAIAPLYAVRGNNDGAWAAALPPSLAVSIGGLRFAMVHDRRDLPEDLGGVNVVVFGHSHRYFERWTDGRLWLNPGSCGRRRFGLEASLAILSIDGGRAAVRKVPLA